MTHSWVLGATFLVAVLVSIVGVAQERVVTPVSFKEGLKLHKETGKPLVIQYSADWCPPCRAQKYRLTKLLATRADFIWAYVDTDKEGPFPDIRSIPYMYLMIDNKCVYTGPGLSDRDLLKKLGLTSNPLEI